MGNLGCYRLYFPECRRIITAFTHLSNGYKVFPSFSLFFFFLFVENSFSLEEFSYLQAIKLFRQQNDNWLNA